MLVLLGLEPQDLKIVLSRACTGGNMTAVQVILDHSADVNARGGSYRSTLLALLRKGRDEFLF